MSMRLASAASINQHACTRRFRQSEDPLPQNDRFSAFFAQWVCSLANTPPHVGASPLPIGEIALHEAPTRRRHAPGRLHVVQKPHPFPHVGHHVPLIPGRGAGMRENTRPTQPLQRHFREKVRPTCHRTPILGHFSFAGRTLSRSHPPSGRAGRTFSRMGRSHVAALKPMTPLLPLTQASMKPPSPLLTPEQQPLKPTTPLQPKNTPKTPISHPQRR